MRLVRNTRRTILTWLIVAPLFIAGAAVLNGWRLGKPDPWFYDPAEREPFFFNRNNAFADSSVLRVSQMAWPKAEKWLHGKPLVALSPEQARAFVGKPFHLPAGTTPYLVRAVYYYEGTGKFMVGQQGEWLYVHHGSLGHTRPPMKRAALVVLLKRQPKHVSVTCSIAA